MEYTVLAKSWNAINNPVSTVRVFITIISITKVEFWNVLSFSCIFGWDY